MTDRHYAGDQTDSQVIKGGHCKSQRKIPLRVPPDSVFMSVPCVSEGNVGVFLPGVDLLLAGQHLQISADFLAGSRWLDDVIHKT